MNFKRINVEQAKLLIQENAAIVDVRDEPSFLQSHINGASHIDNSNIADYISAADLDRALIVYCYHGNMSQGAAAYFGSNGFADTYSLDGGFEAWQAAEGLQNQES